MTRAVVISNPFASRAAEGTLARAVAALRQGGLTVDVAPTLQAGHGAELARAALDDGARMIVAHGGDGTIMDIARTLVGTGVPLGILPAGTGNRLADNLGIRWSSAVAIILAGHARGVDVGRLETSTRSHLFAVAAGCGFDADAMHHTSPRNKRIFGSLAYTLTAFGLAMNIKRAKVRVETDATVWEGHAVSVLLANSGEIVPTGHPFAHHIKLDDGVIDVIILDARSFPGAARVAVRLGTGRSADVRGITFLRARRVTVTAEPALRVQADGEACGLSPFTAEVLPGALTVLAPPAP